MDHPQGLWVISFGQLWDTFSYFGTQTILALYVIHMFALPREQSYQMYAAYAALVFLTPIIAGIVADKWLGSDRAVLVGCVLGIIGNIVLISLHRYWFGLGLAITLVGSGFYKSSATKLVGEFYTKGDFKKNAGYTYFYLATNLGGVMAPIVYGLVAYYISWNYCFLSSAIGLLISLFWLLSNWQYLPKSSAITLSKLITLFFIIALFTAFISILFYDIQVITVVLILLFIASITYLIIAIYQHPNPARKHLFAILLLSFFGLFYFAMGLQVGTTITLLVQTKIHSGALHFGLPASTFSTFYSLFVIVLAPAVALFWAKLKKHQRLPNIAKKITLGITLAGIAMLCFAYAAQTQQTLPFIILGYAVLSAGELIVAPSIYTAISDLAPDNMKSTMMGCWLLFIALGGFASGFIANSAHNIVSKLSFTLHPFAGEFTLMAGFSFIIAIILLFASPKIVKLMR